MSSPKVVFSSKALSLHETHVGLIILFANDCNNLQLQRNSKTSSN